MKASLVIHQEEVLLGGKYVVSIKVFAVEKSRKFPDGIKAKYLLQNAEEGVARLLVDNHQPYGFHMHTKMPHDAGHREGLETVNYRVALEFFLTEVGRIIRNEEA